MNKFHSEYLIGGFFVFVAVFFAVVFLDFVYHQCRKQRKPPAHLIYGQHVSFRFRVKRLVARLLIALGRRKHDPALDVNKLQVFSKFDEMPVDAVFFNTTSSSRQIVLFATARRKNGLVNTMAFLRVPDYSDDLLVLPVYPNSTLYQTDQEQTVRDSYAVAGIRITPVTPNREYRIEYSGKMRLKRSLSQNVDVQLAATWRSSLPTFDFSTDLSRNAMSEAMALQDWSRDYFESLKRNHQSHYEQYGSVQGTVSIDGTAYSISTRGLRDHTIGARRDWNDFERYVLHFIQLENGDGISIGVICAPVMFTRLVIGFLTKSRENVNEAIDNCTIDFNHFNKYDPPDNYTFDFNIGKELYHVEVSSHTKAKLFMGVQSECTILEKWCNVVVNGCKGCAIVEWEYRNNKI